MALLRVRLGLESTAGLESAASRYFLTEEITCKALNLNLSYLSAILQATK